MGFSKGNVRRQRPAIVPAGRGTDAAKAAALAKAHAVARRGFLVFPLAGIVLLAISGTIAIKVMTAMQFTPGGLSLGVLGVLGVVGIFMLLVMRVRLEPPKGIALSDKEARDLVELIEDIRHEMKAPKPQGVFLTNDLGVRLELRPNSGMCGSSRMELAIGLPAMQSLSRLELAALIAREFAHVGAAAGEKAIFVHRMRQTWTKVLAALPRLRSPLSLPLKYFAQAHAPEFFSAAREHFRDAELAADAAAAKLVGAGNIGSALQRLAIARSFLDEYWARIDADMKAGLVGDDRPFHEMADFLPRIAEWEQCEASLRAALSVRTKAEDMEPALIDRLKALGVKPRLPGVLSDPAVALLGDFQHTATEIFEEEWLARQRKAAAPVGKESVSTAEVSSEARPRLGDLDTAALAGPLPLEQAIERARLAESAFGFEEARDRFVDLAEWHQGEARAWLVYAEALLRQGSEDALTCVEQALGLASETTWETGDARAWFDLGKALLDQSREEGVGCLEQAVMIDATLTDEASYLVDAFDERIASQTAVDDDLLADLPRMQAAG